MTGQCCEGGSASSRLARPLYTAAASILPGAVLVLLPKCPLCLAAWLTVATGVGFSAAGAAWVRGIVAVFWVAAVALAVALVTRRQVFRARLPHPWSTSLNCPPVGRRRRQSAHAGFAGATLTS